MYAIYGNIYHQYTPNVSIYTIHGSYGYWKPWFWGFHISRAPHIAKPSSNETAHELLPDSGWGAGWLNRLWNQIFWPRRPQGEVNCNWHNAGGLTCSKLWSWTGCSSFLYFLLYFAGCELWIWMVKPLTNWPFQWIFLFCSLVYGLCMFVLILHKDWTPFTLAKMVPPKLQMHNHS